MGPLRATWAATAVLVLSGVATAACSAGGPSAEPSPSEATSRAPSEGSPRSPSSSPAPPPAPGPVTIAFAGDVHFEGVLRERLEDPATALAPAARALAAADVAVVNLETSVGTGGRPAPGKRFPFQAPPSALTALAAAGVDVATMANNHALDFGRDPLPGLFDALDRSRADDPPLAVVGIGRDVDEAFRPALTRVDDTVVATIGATVADEDPTADPTGQWAATAESPGTADAIVPDRLLRAVGDARRSADVIVVYMHWGVQGQGCPSDAQRSLAEDLVEAGGDVVVGSHAHRLQGDGRIGDGYVAYGLGNYAWYTQGSEATSVTGTLTLTVRPGRTRERPATVVDTRWSPARIGADGLPAPLTGDAAEDFDADRARLRDCAGLAP